MAANMKSQTEEARSATPTCVMCGVAAEHQCEVCGSLVCGQHVRHWLGRPRYCEKCWSNFQRICLSTWLVEST